VPFTFLAHQAPVLPLKLWRPRWFSGAGLALGSMAPDFEKFIRGDVDSRFAHTLLGQVVYCLPVSLLVYLLLTRVVAAPLVRFAPDLGVLRLRDYARRLAAPRRERWATFAASTLVGSFTHVLWDGVTHGDPRVVAIAPFLANRVVVVAGAEVNSASLHQLAASVGGAAVTLALMARLGRDRRVLAWANDAPAPSARTAAPPAAPAPSATLTTRYWLTVAALTATISALLYLAAGPPAHPTAYLTLVSVGLRLPLAGLAALCAAGAIAVRTSPETSAL
jgi:hypothetical protein